MGRRRDRNEESTGVRPTPMPDDRSSVLLRRALRLARDGELRKAAIALRERTAVTDSAASYVIAGAMWARAGRTDDAIAAYREGMWRHQQAGALERARVVANLIHDLDPSQRGLERLRRAS